MSASLARALPSLAALSVLGCFVDATGVGLDGTGVAGTGGGSGAITAAESSSSSGPSTTAATTTSSTTGGGEGGAPPDCPTDWTPGIEGDCYVIMPPDEPSGAYRDDAAELCAFAGSQVGGVGRLATPNVTTDIGTLEALGGAPFDLWIGAIYNAGAQNQFVFEGSGEEFPWAGQQAPWADNQPDKMPDESCVIISGGKLHTYECDDDEFGESPFAAACELAR
jgi:hypothetical protein